MNCVPDSDEDDDEDMFLWDVDVHIWDEEQVLKLCREKIPEFHHLKILNLSIGNRYGWNFLPYLLRFFPKLEMLRLEMVSISICSYFICIKGAQHILNLYFSFL